MPSSLPVTLVADNCVLWWCHDGLQIDEPSMMIVVTKILHSSSIRRSLLSGHPFVSFPYDGGGEDAIVVDVGGDVVVVVDGGHHYCSTTMTTTAAAVVMAVEKYYFDLINVDSRSRLLAVSSIDLC